MQPTQQSLLLRAQNGDPASWDRLVGIYEPLIQGWLRKQSVPPQDAADLTQEVLMAVVKDLPKFEHSGRTGSFRSWLRTITVHRTLAAWRAGRCRADAPGGQPFQEVLDLLADSRSDLSRQWDADHDRHVCQQLLAVVERDFTPSTVQAFRRLVFDGASGAEVAAELGMARPAVYVALARVMKRLREEAADLLDDDSLPVPEDSR